MAHLMMCEYEVLIMLYQRFMFSILGCARSHDSWLCTLKLMMQNQVTLVVLQAWRVYRRVSVGEVGGQTISAAGLSTLITQGNTAQ